jgi:CHRD domain-containing protein
LRKLVVFMIFSTAMALVFATATFANRSAMNMGWVAKLTVAQEVPKQVVKNAAASGSFTATLKGTKLTFKLSYAKLTGPVLAAHIHLGAMGQAGNVVVPLCTLCKNPATGTVTVSAALQKDFTKHLLYVNVHTAKNPNGEIRGQLGM